MTGASGPVGRSAGRSAGWGVALLCVVLIGTFWRGAPVNRFGRYRSNRSRPAVPPRSTHLCLVEFDAKIRISPHLKQKNVPGRFYSLPAHQSHGGGDAWEGGHPEFNRRTKRPVRLQASLMSAVRPALFGSQGGQTDLFIFMAGHRGTSGSFSRGTNGSFLFHGGPPPKGWGRDRTYRLRQSMLFANRCADAIIENIKLSA